MPALGCQSLCTKIIIHTKVQLNLGTHNTILLLTIYYTGSLVGTLALTFMVQCHCSFFVSLLRLLSVAANLQHSGQVLPVPV